MKKINKMNLSIWFKRGRLNLSRWLCLHSRLFLLLLFFHTNIFANITLPAIFGNGMVLQQNTTITVWGWGKPGEEVSVTGSWDNQTVKVKVPSNATWQLKLQTPIGSYIPHTLTFQGYNKIVLDNILIGEVWLCSGQSNMEWSARLKFNNWEEEVRNANHPNIRFFSVAHKTATTPQIDLSGQWQVCSPETVIDFSATAYFFGREIQKNLNVPVGLINSSWGGTPAEPWCSAEAIAKDKKLTEIANLQTEVAWGPVKPALIFNVMIAPLIPFKIAGALWYQGESNTGQPHTYNKLLVALIEDWRSKWQDNFPFYYVQIAPFEYQTPLQGVLLRDAQRLAMNTPNTGMVVVSDIGNTKDIHPGNKQDVGKRLANWALNRTYKKTDIPFSGPLYKEMKIEKNKIRISFDYAEKALVCKGKELTHFEIAGEDKKFVVAKAKIEGNTIVVQAKEIKNPVAVRFAWSNTAEPNLFNSAGLPASCFRTDTWEIKLY